MGPPPKCLGGSWGFDAIFSDKNCHDYTTILKYLEYLEYLEYGNWEIPKGDMTYNLQLKIGHELHSGYISTQRKCKDLGSECPGRA